MVQFSMIAIVLSSALSSVAVAKSCHKGGIYCGSALLSRGDYISNINTGLAAVLLEQTTFNQQNSLWTCTDSHGIEFEQLCTGSCDTNGNDDDYCLEKRAADAAEDAAEDGSIAAHDGGFPKVWVA